VAISTTVIVCDPVDPYDLFAAARQVAGNPARWAEHDFGAVRMLQTRGGQGARALVAVHFPARGGRYREDGGPSWYAMVTFTNSGLASAQARQERLAAALGAHLAGAGLSWIWRYEDGPWQAGGRPRAGR
jgi:hypothetical protein